MDRIEPCGASSTGAPSEAASYEQQVSSLQKEAKSLQSQKNSRSQTLAALSLAIAEVPTHGLRKQPVPRRVREERDWLSSLLGRMGIEAWCDTGDAVLALFQDPDGVQQALHAKGLSAERYHGRPELCDWLILHVPGRSQLFETLCQTLVDLHA